MDAAFAGTDRRPSEQNAGREEHHLSRNEKHRRAHPHRGAVSIYPERNAKGDCYARQNKQSLVLSEHADHKKRARSS